MYGLKIALNHPNKIKEAKTIPEAKLSKPKMEKPIGPVFNEILSFRQKKSYYFINSLYLEKLINVPGKEFF